MDTPEPEKKKTKPAPLDREARLAEKLRQNLKRRKAAARKSKT